MWVNSTVVRDRLIEAGLPPTTPAAFVQNGTLPQQRIVVTELAALPDVAHRQAIASPAMLFIGEVAGFAAKFAWFGSEPIHDACPPAQAAVYGSS